MLRVRGGAVRRPQSAPHMHVLVCICSNVRQFFHRWPGPHLCYVTSTFRVKRGGGGRGTNKGCPCAAVESKISNLSLEIAKLRYRVACREQSCHRRTKCAIPLPRLHCAQTVQALPPCITGHLFCPVLWGWTTDPSCGEQLCCVPGGGGQSSHGFACAPPPPHPGCTMNCDSTRHIQKSRHPTPDHARISTALSSNTEWGYTNLHTTGAALPCVCNVPQGRPG